MSADADGTPADPFLNPRRSTGVCHVSVVNDGRMVVEDVDADQTTSSSPAAAALSTICVSPSVAVETRVSSGLQNAAARLASNAAACGGADVIVPHTRKRERPAVALAHAGTTASTTAAPPQASRRRANGVALSCSRHVGGAARTFEARRQRGNTERSDEDALSEATCGEDGGGDEAGYAPDDDGEGDAEERALAAAASSLTTGPGAFTAASAASATPHPWLVTDAFHVCLWFVLRYAGDALSAEDLWACRAVLSLTAVSATDEGHGGVCALSKDAFSGAKGAETTTALAAAEQAPGVSMEPDIWAWSGSEESELLLRLLLRSPHSFTVRHLELRYGDWLHVQLALNALTRRRFLWWTTTGTSLSSAAGDAEAVRLHGAEEDVTTDRKKAPLIPVDELTCTEMAPSPFVEHYDGARVARLLLSSCDEVKSQHRHAATVGESAPTLSCAETVIRVAQAVRATELRTFLTTLRHCSKARAALNESTPKEKCITSATVSTLCTSPSVFCKSDVAGASAEAKPRPVQLPKSGGGAKLVACARPGQTSHNGLYDAIPGRKRDMICYLVERRYSVWAPASTVSGVPAASSTTHSTAAGTVVPSHGTPRTAPRALSSAPSAATCGPRSALRCPSSVVSAGDRSESRRCFLTVTEEADVVAQCWDRIIGSVYVPHAGLKQNLVRVAELFHVLTSNSGAGLLSERSAKGLAATMTVATPPNLLMVRSQLLLLLQALHAARYEARPGSKAFLESVPHALLPRWFLPRLTAKVTTRAVPRASRPPDRGIPSGGRAGSKTESQGYHPSVSAESSDGDSTLMDDIVCSARSFQAFDVAEDGAATQTCEITLHVRLFASPAILQEYRRALSTQRELYYATDGAVTGAQRHRGKSGTFLSRMYETVMAAVRAGVARVKRHPVYGCSAASASFVSDETTRFGSIGPPAHPVVSEAPPSPKASTPSATVSLEALAYQQGCYAEHLLIFTPLYRWFACLEALFPLLQSARRYADANACLRCLLYEPIFVLHHIPVGGTHCNISPITYAFRYRAHKRGKWLIRLAQNLSHQKRYAEALAVLTKAQAGYRELSSYAMNDARSKPTATSVGPACGSNYERLPCDAMSNSTAAALCDVLAGNRSPAIESVLPQEVQRRGRMLRVFWPATASVSSATGGDNTLLTAAEKPSPGSLALLHAAWEYVRDRYCRRQDRLALEKSLAMMHRKVHQWTPPAPNLELETRRLADVAVRRVRGVRDELDRMLWREPTGQARKRSGASSGAAAEAAKSTTSCGARSLQRCPALPVEQFVLQYYLSRWNGASTTAAAASPAADPHHRRPTEIFAVDYTEPETERSNDVGGATITSVWSGAHCEGHWIACLARAFLWDCYWAFPSASPSLDTFSGSAHVQESDRPTGEVLWLSPFQDGPLDLTTPLQFLWRRRALIEARLAKLERCTREELVAYVAAHIKMERRKSDEEASLGMAKERGRGAESEAPRSEERAVQREEVDEDGDGNEERACRRRSRGEAGCGLHHHRYSSETEEALCAEHEEDSVLLVSPVAETSLSFAKSETSSLLRGWAEQERKAEAEEVKPMTDSADTSLSLFAPTLSIPEAWKVSVGPLPLLDVLRAIPLKPLWRLLRCLYLSPVTEGVPLEFSGFPDLVFWRAGGISDGVCSNAAARASVEDSAAMLRPSFCLMEVKSPSDSLSTKQIAVNDLLHRCGFDVCVVRVDEVHHDGQRVSTKRIR
ncbi:hypothetical protein LSCM4_00277 [Leishmania orientalis]|uniref:Fanconi-associated nuclease n=1 Tax=Leishmania orientalis TaxID=2249476 RepID=A0A836GGH1_9TRYP|nr:hypothetical protein LSCM4_00277 [Leishmania orientalis]